MQNFEFDKIVLAIAFAIFTIIISSNISDTIYLSDKESAKRGYEIVVNDESSTPGESDPSANTLPDVLNMSEIMAKSDALAGKEIFKKCAICHTAGKGEPNKIGPNLWGIVGSNTAANQSFVYSTSMKNRGAEGDKWDYETLYRYLYSPKKFVPGTKMAFAGIKDNTDRVNLIAYLRTLADKQLSLP